MVEAAGRVCRAYHWC